MESSLVLGYWSMRGLGEVVRLFLEYLGQKYSEVKYADRAKWFEEDKPKLKSPFPNIPYLKDGEKVICETGLIKKYKRKKKIIKIPKFFFLSINYKTLKILFKIISKN